MGSTSGEPGEVGRGEREKNPKIGEFSFRGILQPTTGYSQDACRLPKAAWCWLATKFVGQQKQRPKGGIPEGGPIPLHRDTTILASPIVYKIYCNNVGSARKLYCPIVWAIRGRGGGAKKRVWVGRKGGFFSHTPIHKTISCIGYCVGLCTRSPFSRLKHRLSPRSCMTKPQKLAREEYKTRNSHPAPPFV